MDPNNTNPSNTPPAPDAPAPAPAPTPTSAPEVATPFPAATDAPQGPKPTNNKKFILIGAIAGAVVLLAVIGVLVFSMLTSVSKEDYRDAARQLNEVSRANSALTSDASGLSYSFNSADGTFGDDLADLKESLETLKAENDELSKLKAVRVGEGAKLFKEYNDKSDAYVAFSSELMTSFERLHPAMATCDGVSSSSSDTSARVKALNECADALAVATDIPNAALKEFSASLATAYKDLADVYEKISKLTNPYGSQYEEYKALRDKMYAAQDTTRDASKKLSTEMSDRNDEVSPNDALKALADYLNDQQRS